MPACYADLHAHTTYSDGQLAPAALLEKAAARGLRVLAITDHDTLAGWDAARTAAAGGPVELIPGVELSVTVGGQEVHLLGYGFDPFHEGLRAHLEWFADARRERARRMVERLNAHGIELAFAAVQQAAGDAHAIGRPHVAMALVDAGYVDTHDDAFEHYLHQGGPAFVEKPEFPAADALDLLHAAGSIGVLAHPGHWTSGRTLHLLRRAGLDGIEVRHPSHNASLVAYYQRLARDFGLASTGGSDYHGHRPGDEERLGTCGLNRAEWDAVSDAVRGAPTTR
jgi:hypothetical protein